MDKFWLEQELPEHVIHVEQLDNNKLIIKADKRNFTAHKYKHRQLRLANPIDHIYETMPREYVAYNIWEDIWDAYQVLFIIRDIDAEYIRVDNIGVELIVIGVWYVSYIDVDLAATAVF